MDTNFIITEYEKIQGMAKKLAKADADEYFDKLTKGKPALNKTDYEHDQYNKHLIGMVQMASNQVSGEL